MNADIESNAHFTRRLESFTDLVFGFSLSLLAGRLVVPTRAADILGHPIGLVGFVVTFGLIVGVWFLNHRTFRYFYTPALLENALIFAQLAAVALMPYALDVLFRFSFAASGPIVLYDGVLCTILISHAIIAYRGFIRRYRDWDDASRRRHWRSCVLTAAMGTCFLIGLVGAAIDRQIGFYAYWLFAPVALLIRSFYRGLPRFARDDARAPATSPIS